MTGARNPVYSIENLIPLAKELKIYFDSVDLKEFKDELEKAHQDYRKPLESWGAFIYKWFNLRKRTVDFEEAIHKTEALIQNANQQGTADDAKAHLAEAKQSIIETFVKTETAGWLDTSANTNILRGFIKQLADSDPNIQLTSAEIQTLCEIFLLMKTKQDQNEELLTEEEKKLIEVKKEHSEREIEISRLKMETEHYLEMIKTLKEREVEGTLQLQKIEENQLRKQEELKDVLEKLKGLSKSIVLTVTGMDTLTEAQVNDLTKVAQSAVSIYAKEMAGLRERQNELAALKTRTHQENNASDVPSSYETLFTQLKETRLGDIKAVKDARGNDKVVKKQTKVKNKLELAFAAKLGPNASKLNLETNKLNPNVTKLNSECDRRQSLYGNGFYAQKKTDDVKIQEDYSKNNEPFLAAKRKIGDFFLKTVAPQIKPTSSQQTEPAVMKKTNSPG